MSLSAPSYLIASSVFDRLDRKIDEAKGEVKERFARVKNIEKKITGKKEYKGFYEKVSRKLKKKGNPLNLTPVTYYLIKLTAASAVFIFWAGRNMFLSLVLAVFAYFAVDIIYYSRDREEKKIILSDLPNIYDMLDIQISAGIVPASALTEIYDIPNSKRLKKDLEEVSAEIILRKNPDKILDKFMDRYDLIEIDNFVLSMKQSYSSGKIREILMNQGDVLSENNIYEIQKETGLMSEKFMIIILLILVAIVSIISFSFFTQIKDSMFMLIK